MLQVLLFRLARSTIARYFIGWVFAHMSFIIPVTRLRETDTLFAFHHPKPSHPVHILIVPKRARESLRELSPDDADFMRELFATVNSLVEELRLEEMGYRLICNGGAYQDVPHLHFHLISGEL